MHDNELGQLERLTSGETLVIDRRRRSESQLKAAVRLDTTYSMYGKMERGVVERGEVDVLPLKDHEICLLLRRRKELRQEDVAKAMNICRYWFNQMERGEVGCSELVKFWEK